MIVTMVPASFQYVNYNEYALKRNSVTHTVDFDEVFEMGRYFWGLGKTTMTFPRNFIFVDFGGTNELSVFDAKGLEITLKSSFEYRINKDRLVDMYRTYGLGYEAQIVNKARSIIKNKASQKYNVEDYFRDRKRITIELNEFLTEELKSVFVDVPKGKFQLRDVLLPPQTKDRYEQIAIITQQNQMKNFSKESQEVRANTALQLINYTKTTEKITQEAAAKVQAIKQNATAVAFRITQRAVAEGYKEVFSQLGITDGKDKMEIIKLLAVHSGTRYIVGAGNEITLNLT